MSVRALILSAAILTAVFGASALDADELITSANAADAQCLTPAQRRHVSASGKVVPLSKAIRAARARRTELVDAKLCKSPKGLVYRLTLLAHDGKVTRATIDAASGKLAEGG